MSPLPADAAAAMETAAAVAGLDDFGDGRFVEGLDRYLDSLHREAGLSQLGEQLVAADLSGLLVNRLRFEDDLKRHPEILEEELAEPLVIIGLPRTGTTKLQQLVSRDPGVLSLPYWRIANVAPLPGSGPEPPDPRIAISDEIVAAQAQMAPDLMRAHAPQTHEPEEDVFLMRMTFEAQINGATDYVPSYHGWLREQPTEYSYRYLRRLLQYVQWQQGGGRGRPWVLKSPLHGSQLDTIVSVFGGARFVQCHRDPLVAVPSTLRLYEAVWSSRGNGNGREELASLLLPQWADEMAQNLRLRYEMKGLDVLDLAYRDIVDDSDGAIERVYEFWDRPLTTDARRAMKEGEAANPQHKFGRHSYSLGRYGLEEADVTAAFERYEQMFGHLLGPRARERGGDEAAPVRAGGSPGHSVRLDGKVVLITGASAGIGAGLARGLAARGASVVGTARRQEPGHALERELQQAGLDFLFVAGDVAVRSDCEAAVSAALERHGRIDALINNAGLSLPNGRVEEIEDDDWRAILDTTLEGVMRMTRAVLPTMQDQAGGVVINVASLVALHGIARMGAYAAAKGGVLSFTRVLAIENLENNIRANAVLMGAVDTPMSSASMLDYGRSIHGADWEPDDATLAAADAMLMRPDDVAPAVALLCSDDAREINGSVIAVDRCWSAGSMTSSMLYMGAAGMLAG